MSSVREIASRVGVSVATVSRVINNDPRVSEAMRDRVLKAANQSRYVPKVGTRSTMNIALLYTDEPSLESPFDSALMQGMGERMDEYGFDLMILRGSRTRNPSETYTQMLMRKGVRGAVIRTTSRTRDACEEIATEGFPAVVVGDRFDNPKVSFVASDSRSGSQQAIEHLLKLGHRRIAICTNVVDDSDHADRIHGYTDAMKAAGLALDPGLIVRTPANRSGGKQIIRRLMTGKNCPTAVYLVDPMAAVGAMHELMNMGLKVPTDVSLIGFDDGELRHLMQPTMTAVCQDATEIGREVFEVLHSIVGSHGKVTAQRRTLPTFLEIHGSTGPVPNRPA
jgi:DNA-binding LacI/PurR family transcriptional regulator